MRRMRGEPQDAYSPSDVWAARLVPVVGLSGSALSAYALAGREGLATGQFVFAVAALSLLPVAASPPASLVRVGPRMRTFLAVQSWVLQSLVLLLLAISQPIALLPAALIAAQSHLVLQSRHDLPSAFALALAATQSLVAFLVHPSAVSMLALPVVVTAATAVGALVHGRAVRRGLVRPLRHLALEAPSRRATATRVRAALVLGFVALLCALTLHAGLGVAGRAVEDLRARFDEPPPPPPAEPEKPPPASAGGGGGAAGRSQGGQEAGTSFPDSLSYDQPYGGTGDQLVLRLQPIGGTIPQRGLGPIYLRAVVLDTFGPNGISRSSGIRSRTVTDVSDGATDGWTRPSVLPSTTASREWEIEQDTIHMGAGAASVIPTVDPVHAIGRSPVVWYADDVVTTAAPQQGWFTTREMAALPPPQGSVLAGKRALHADPLFITLPPDTGVITRLRSEAAALTANAVDDHARVLAVVDHFHEGFDYARKPPAGRGIAALEELLDARRGYCLQFAGAAALMLRSQRIPTRVVQGFLASEWSAVAGRYDVYPPDVHAWIEVYFQGVGWVRFDPTPAEERLAAVHGTGPSAGAWLEDALGMAQRFLEGDEGMSLDDLAALLAEGPGAVQRSLGRGVLAIVALVVIAAGVYLLLPGRRRAKAQGDPGISDSARIAQGHYERALTQLARLGHRKRPSQTPREFATALASTGDHILEPFEDLTERFYEARFGERPLSGADVSRLDAFILELRGVERVRA